MPYTNGVASTLTTNIVPVQGLFDASGNCLGLVGPGGAYFSPPLTNDAITNATINNSVIGNITPTTGIFTNVIATGTVNCQGNLSVNSNLIVSSTLPTIASGFGTGATIVASSTAAFAVTVGTASPSGTITFPAAPHGWAVACQDVTSASTVFSQQSASTSTSITVTGYSVTTGLPVNFNAGDVLVFTAMAY
jgi:hypothetical protein